MESKLLSPRARAFSVDELLNRRERQMGAVDVTGDQKSAGEACAPSRDTDAQGDGRDLTGYPSVADDGGVGSGSHVTEYAGT